jgi:serine/threonine-protein kinase RsbW
MIRLTIESRLENVALIGGSVRGIAEMLSIEAIWGYQLELCVVEAVTNVIKHAYHFEAGHSVDVEIHIHQDRLTFKISDTGESMDESKIAPLQFDPLKVETLPEGGMGVFILKSLMDEVDYEIVNGRNMLTMSKTFKTQQPSE